MAFLEETSISLPAGEVNDALVAAVDANDGGAFRDLHYVTSRNKPNTARKMSGTGGVGVSYAIDSIAPGGAFESIVLDAGLYMNILNDCKFRECTSFKFRGHDLISFGFRLAGDAAIVFDNKSQANLRGFSANTILHPRGGVKAEWIKSESTVTAVAIGCTREYLVEKIGLAPEAAPRAFSRFLRGGEPELFFKPLYLNAEMRQVLMSLLNLPYKNQTRALVLQAKAIELICAALSELEKLEGHPSLPVTLSSRDIEKIHYAKELVLAGLPGHPNVSDLSREVALNRNKLSYGFKYLFGLTITEFCVEQKMQQALVMLREPNMTVSRVSDRLGYLNVSSFSRAFRKHQGHSPLIVLHGRG